MHFAENCQNLLKMRADRVCFQQTKKIMQKYLSNGYNLLPIFEQFKQRRSKDLIIKCIKQTLKQQMLELEGQLFANKLIQSLKIYDNINTTKINDYLLHLKEIFAGQQQACIDFLSYFKYKAQFMISTRYHTVEIPVQPITSKKKFAIYQLFLKYLESKGGFDTQVHYQQPNEEEWYDTGFNLCKNSYSFKQTIQILKLYELYNGKQDQMIAHMQQEPSKKESKFKKQQVNQFILNYLIIGLIYVYRVSNNLDRFIGCSLEKFIQIHQNILDTLEVQDKKVILKVGIHSTQFQDEDQIKQTVDDKDIVFICNRIGVRYRPVGYPKWVKDNSQTNLYRKEKLSVMDKIKMEMNNIIKGEQIKKTKKQKVHASKALKKQWLEKY